jgi:small ubiquitin-related modifier
MKKKDAKLQNGAKARRCDAVYECCRTFVEQQLKSGGTNQVVISLLLFSDDADQRFVGVPLSEALGALEREKDLTPRDGTNYAAPWMEIESKMLAAPWCEQNWVVFLSDGRPGEMGSKRIPMLGHEPTTVKNHKKTFDSAPTVVRRLASKLGAAFSLYAVAIGDEDSAWLTRLADVAASSGAKTGEFKKLTAAALSLQVIKDPNIVTAKVRGHDGTEVLFKLNRKSPLKKLMDVYAQQHGGTPGAAFTFIFEGNRVVETATPDDLEMENGDVIDAMLEHSGSVHTAASRMAPPPKASPSMAPPRPLLAARAARSQSSTSAARTLGETFSSISSALTSSMGPAAAAPERPVTFEHPEAWKQAGNFLGEQKHRAGMLQPDHVSWETMDIRIRTDPFAKGGQRNAYHFFYGERAAEKHMVAKENRRQEAYKDRLATHRLEIGAAEYARDLATTFNEMMAAAADANLGGAEAPPAVEVLPVQVMRFWQVDTNRYSSHTFSGIKCIDAAAGYRYLAVEPFLEGEFQKFNGNNGFVKKSPISAGRSQSQCAVDSQDLTGCRIRMLADTIMMAQGAVATIVGPHGRDPAGHKMWKLDNGCDVAETLFGTACEVEYRSSLDMYADLLPHAFTHWTYEHTLATARVGEEAMVCDIQGVGVRYTDVTVHTQVSSSATECRRSFQRS